MTYVTYARFTTRGSGSPPETLFSPRRWRVRERCESREFDAKGGANNPRRGPPGEELCIRSTRVFLTRRSNFISHSSGHTNYVAFWRPTRARINMEFSCSRVQTRNVRKRHDFSRPGLSVDARDVTCSQLPIGAAVVRVTTGDENPNGVYLIRVTRLYNKIFRLPDGFTTETYMANWSKNARNRRTAENQLFNLFKKQ